MVAFSRECARMLVCRALSMGANRIIVSSANSDGLRFVGEFGGVEKFRCRRMYLGCRVDERVEYIYGILNYAKG